MIGEKILLRVYLRSSDLYHFSPIYERLVQAASRQRLAGATVLRGIMGFSSRSMLMPSDYRLSSASPVIVELVDEGKKIGDFAQQVLPQQMKTGLATLERASVLMYRKKGGSHESHLSEPIEPLSTLPDLKGDALMRIDHDGVLLRIFIGESDEWENKPLFEAIIQKARAAGLAGGTVLKGSMGFGANSVLHTNKVLVLSTDLPIVIEIVDSREKIENFLPTLDSLVREGMITMEGVHIYKYTHDLADAAKKQLQ
ncbi:MAG: DUF190 domain-containing protein [Phycisphaerae bacterium]|nr:DUF190 domain-containing protein [Phycisphaerae bacterium]